jgi:hypothetical protein
MEPLRARTLFSLVGEEAAIRGFFEARPGVSELRLHRHTAETLEITVKLEETEPEDIVAGLIGAGIGVRRVGPAEWALEQQLIDLMSTGEEA